MELILYRSMGEALRIHFGDVIVKMEKKMRENPAPKKALDEYRDEHRRQVVDAVEEGFRYHGIFAISSRVESNRTHKLTPACRQPTHVQTISKFRPTIKSKS